MKLIYKNGEKPTFTTKVMYAIFTFLLVSGYMYFSRLNGVDGTFELLWGAFLDGQLTW